MWTVPAVAPVAAPPAPVPAAPARTPEAQQVLPPGQLAHGYTVLPADRNRNGSLTIGREFGNEVVLSPIHFRCPATMRGWILAPVPVLHDLGSFNGTFVNGPQVPGVGAARAGQRGDLR